MGDLLRERRQFSANFFLRGILQLRDILRLRENAVVRRYSQAVHEKCVQMGITPKLRGFEEVGGGWKMVVMDALDEEYETLDRKALPADTRERIRERLHELHQVSFVRGDVRDLNIMVRKGGLCLSTSTGQVSLDRPAILSISIRSILGDQMMYQMVC